MRLHTELVIPDQTIDRAVDDLSRLASEMTRYFKLSTSSDVLENLKVDQWIKIAKGESVKSFGGTIIPRYIPSKGWKNISDVEVNAQVIGFIEDQDCKRVNVIVDYHGTVDILGDNVGIVLAEKKSRNIEGVPEDYIEEVELDEWGGEWEASNLVKDPDSVDQEVALIEGTDPLKMNALQALKEVLIRLIGKNKTQGIEKSLENLEHYFGAHLLQVDYEKRLIRRSLSLRDGVKLNESVEVGSVFVHRDLPQESFKIYWVHGYDKDRNMVITREMIINTESKGDIQLEYASENNTYIPSDLVKGVVYDYASELLEVLIQAEKNQAELEKGSAILLLQGLKGKFSKKGR